MIVQFSVAAHKALTKQEGPNVCWDAQKVPLLCFRSDKEFRTLPLINKKAAIEKKMEHSNKRLALLVLSGL